MKKKFSPSLSLGSINPQVAILNKHFLKDGLVANMGSGNIFCGFQGPCFSYGLVIGPKFLFLKFMQYICTFYRLYSLLLILDFQRIIICFALYLHECKISFYLLICNTKWFLHFEISDLSYYTNRYLHNVE